MARHLSTPNKSRIRRDLSTVDLAIIHYTGSNNIEGTVSWFQNPEARVSSHYVIGKDGEVVEFEDPTRILWHAGKSRWEDHDGCNWRSIGFELVGTGDDFPVEQVESTARQIHYLMSSLGVPIRCVLGHEQISPGRKVDPGPMFPWGDMGAFMSFLFDRDLQEVFDWFGHERLISVDKDRATMGPGDD